MVTRTWTFFIDRSCGARLVPEALRQSGESVEVHDSIFAQDAPDEEWLPVAGRAGWLVVTKDSAIARNHLQRMMVTRYAARLFVFVSAGVRGPEMAAAIAKSARAMKAHADCQEAPFIAKVYKSGKVEIWKDRVVLRAEIDGGG